MNKIIVLAFTFAVTAFGVGGLWVESKNTAYYDIGPGPTIARPDVAIDIGPGPTMPKYAVEAGPGPSFVDSPTQVAVLDGPGPDAVA